MHQSSAASISARQAQLEGSSCGACMICSPASQTRSRGEARPGCCLPHRSLQSAQQHAPRKSGGLLGRSGLHTHTSFARGGEQSGRAEPAHCRQECRAQSLSPLLAQCCTAATHLLQCGGDPLRQVWSEVGGAVAEEGGVDAALRRLKLAGEGERRRQVRHDERPNR